MTLKNDIIKFTHNSVMKVDMTDAILKLSIDDIYTLKAISDK